MKVVFFNPVAHKLMGLCTSCGETAKHAQGRDIFYRRWFQCEYCGARTRDRQYIDQFLASHIKTPSGELVWTGEKWDVSS